MSKGKKQAIAVGRIVAAVAAIGLAAPLLSLAPANAQGTNHSPQHAGSAAAAGYHAAMEKMNRDMAAEPPSGNPDRDFASLMVKHHQSAVDMARVELEHGRDATMRQTAQKVIEDQQREIVDLRRWLASQPTR